jgi:hypothetical protein
MLNSKRCPPQLAVVLASLLLWGSFAWGLPAEAPAEGEAEVAPAEGAWKCGHCGTANDASANYCKECGAEKGGEAETAPKNPWARVRLSAAYDYAKCPECGKKNEIQAKSCSRCGVELPQPSAEMTDPDTVFVPGRGYYEDGALVEPAKTREGYWITGLVLTVSGLTVLGFAGYYGGDVGGAIAALPCLAAVVTGVTLFIIGVGKTKPVYAFEKSQLNEPAGGGPYVLRPADSGGVALKVEVTGVGF